MQIVFFDDNTWEDLLPLTYTRPMADIRCGIYTNIERAQKLWDNCNVAFQTKEYLQAKFCSSIDGEQIYINGKVLLDKTLANAINQLNVGESLYKNELFIALRSNVKIDTIYESHAEKKSYAHSIICIENLWDIFAKNEVAINSDWESFVEGRTSQPLSKTNMLIGEESHVFIEEGAKIEASILNAQSGKIYVAANAEIMENTAIRGPFVLGEGSVVKMGAKIYGATTIGKGSKVGGEMNNVVFFANSNKAHDGYLGNTVVGEWCNFGADSNNSNLKNNYEEVKLWSEKEAGFKKTGLQFCGLIMADHSKCGINSMFNTGTVVGVSCNIFGAGFPRNFIPSFSWGGASGITEYKLDKAFQTMEKVYERRHIELNEAEKNMYSYIYNQTQNQRTK